MDDVIEEGDRISARFTYNGTFSNPFMGYRPNGAAFLALFGGSERRGLYFASLAMLILFVVIYNLLSKPINRLQTEAAKTGRRLDNARELQASWDRSLLIRTPLLVASLLTQCLALLAASA